MGSAESPLRRQDHERFASHLAISPEDYIGALEAAGVHIADEEARCHVARAWARIDWIKDRTTFLRTVLQ